MNNQSYHTDRMNEYPDTLLTTAELGEADVPVTPLPNPGEGGPVAVSYTHLDVYKRQRQSISATVSSSCPGKRERYWPISP